MTPLARSPARRSRRRLSFSNVAAERGSEGEGRAAPLRSNTHLLSPPPTPFSPLCQGERITSEPIAEVNGKVQHKGASIKYVRRIFVFFNPPSPLVHKFTQPPLLSSSTLSTFGPALPPTV